MNPVTNPLRILVTGFRPFPGAKNNPSATLARALARQRRFQREDIVIHHHIFDVRWNSVARDLADQIARHRPDILLMFGVATRTKWLRIETRAHDRRTLLWPDATGARRSAHRNSSPDGTPCIAGSRKTGAKSAGSFSARLVTSARNSGIDARLSHDAGSYLCNELFWQALNHPHARSGAMLAAFVHIPLSSRQHGAKIRKAGAAILLRLVIEHRGRNVRAFVNRPR